MSDRRSAWAVVIPAERFEAERLVQHDVLELAGLTDRAGPRSGDDVLVVRDEQTPLVVAVGRVSPAGGVPGHDPDDPDDPVAGNGGPLVVSYLRRALDRPVPAADLALRGPVTPIPGETFRRWSGRVAAPGTRRSWLVSVDLPIEASSAAEAARVFWSYVLELGPRELPAFVSPARNELAMQAFVLGAEANQDPEEDD
ncbi:hypothetical protein [Plantactinospora sp. KBS50]|uniref:hypothetical protein n=1 Tax=Plantactinospora sp. KBS50 TaxID=2024580 RepID=UPI001E3CD545|nr:hypothetical protein [Plantactinospora sp. KBS50]